MTPAEKERRILKALGMDDQEPKPNLNKEKAKNKRYCFSIYAD